MATAQKKKTPAKKKATPSPEPVFQVEIRKTAVCGSCFSDLGSIKAEMASEVEGEVSVEEMEVYVDTDPYKVSLEDLKWRCSNCGKLVDMSGFYFA